MEKVNGIVDLTIDELKTIEGGNGLIKRFFKWLASDVACDIVCPKGGSSGRDAFEQGMADFAFSPLKA